MRRYRAAGLVKEMLDEYRRRRDELHAWLTADPRISCVKPNGAFYLFIDISALLSPDGIRTSAEFAERLLHEAHVALTAGEGVRGAGLPAHLVRDLDGAAEGRHRRIHAFIRSSSRGKVPAASRRMTTE